MAQPILPAEGAYSEIEKNFIENSPAGLWPENQDSNFGQLRKVLLEPLQECSDKLTSLNLERFASTAENYLSLWEQDLHIPVAPAGKTAQERRDIIAAKLIYGPFTRMRRAALIESFLSTTFGAAVSLTPEGVPLDAGGIPLFSGETDLIGAYRVYEDIEDFSYELWIKNTITPDLDALERELRRITPSGHSFTIDNTKANVLSYRWAVRNKQPVLYITGGNTVDQAYGNNATANGGALIDQAALRTLTGNQDDGALELDGVDDYFSIPSAPQLDVGDRFSVEAWVNLDSFTGNPRIFTKGGLSYEFTINSVGEVRLQVAQTAVMMAHSSLLLSTGTTYHLVAVKNGPVRKIYIDGVDVTMLDTNETIVDNTNALVIGRLNGSPSNWLNGRVDEPALYNYPLSHAEVLENYNTGKDIA